MKTSLEQKNDLEEMLIELLGVECVFDNLMRKLNTDLAVELLEAIATDYDIETEA